MKQLGLSLLVIIALSSAGLMAEATQGYNHASQYMKHGKKGKHSKRTVASKKSKKSKAKHKKKKKKSY
jgi:UPF0716 family protein affecting phage T7 exclusion